MDSQFHGVLEGAAIVCLFCGATPQTEHERRFVTNNVHTICYTCAKDAVSLVENEPLRHAISRLRSFKR